jgi:O-antigen/teichoic acid export membrane protein
MPPIYRRALNGLTYFATFVGARGALFVAPLVLSNVLSTVNYGRLEWAYASATLVAALLTMGTASLSPLVLNGERDGHESIAIGHQHLLVSAICLFAVGVAVISWRLDGRNATAAQALALTAGLVAAIAMQSLAGVEYKSVGRASASLMIDAVLMVAIAAGAVVWHLAGAADASPGAWVAIVGVATALTWRQWRRTRVLGAMPPGLWRQVVLDGIPLMLTGLVGTLVASSGRLGIGLLADPSLTGTYAVLSRGAALPIIAHQVVLVARFRRLFVEDDKRLVATLTVILGWVAASATGLWLARRYVGLLLGPSFDRAARGHSTELGWLLGQSVLWSAVALNDLVNTRRGHAAAVLRISLPALLVLSLGGWLVARGIGIDLVTFVRVHGVVMLSFFAVQCAAMACYGSGLWRAWTIALAGWLLPLLLVEWRSPL